MFVRNLVLACWSCLKGHRSGSCNHASRPLYALKNKGRPYPSSGIRSEESPDISSLDSPDFKIFREAVMMDPILRRRFYHEKDPSKLARKKRKLKRSNCPRSAESDITMDVITDYDFEMWKVLCGIEDDFRPLNSFVNAAFSSSAEASGPPPIPRLILPPPVVSYCDDVQRDEAHLYHVGAFGSYATVDGEVVNAEMDFIAEEEWQCAVAESEIAEDMDNLLKASTTVKGPFSGDLDPLFGGIVC